ncbi:hypothetical protein [Ralstonia sp. OTU4908]|uniref:hypothetical protein n=1 Tax=Ralstonia sp. OTU4908 TaxID=3043851 RepID=UPI00313AFB9D
MVTTEQTAKRRAEFLQKLQTLLTEYNASISWSCDPCSDTHGIYGDVITVDVDGREVVRTDEGCGHLDADNLKALLTWGS